ncbi:MAG: MerR family DNA-binding protein, partial [Chloroflexi bacterium]|nr:MerR family DNA-binding protein [Chloroflexota bacterium]
KFITKGRRLGFSLAEIGTVLDLHGQARHPCRHVVALLDRKVAEIESVLADLNSFRDELAGLRDSAVTNLDQVRDGESVCSIIEQGIHHEGELALAWLGSLNLTGSR